MASRLLRSCVRKRSAKSTTRGPDTRLRLIVAGEHAVDQPDADRFGVHGALAGVIDALGAVAAHQPEQPVDLAHLRPGQRMLQQRGA